MKFSANLGFLWADQTLPEAIRLAGQAGFDAVECHWPYAYSASQIRNTLDESGLTMLGINTVRGNAEAGENGLSALPGREGEAQRSIDQAINFAAAIGCEAVHVMAGYANGESAHECFLRNLEYACRQMPQGMTILIEPLNRHDAPGYFLQTTGQATEIINELGNPQVRLMFDCYHIGRTEGDLITRFKELRPLIGHVQFAAVPDRGPPDHGEVNYAAVLQALELAGWDRAFGAEYKPVGPTGESLGWMKFFREHDLTYPPFENDAKASNR